MPTDFAEDALPEVIWAIDPGPVTSAFVGLETESALPVSPILAGNDVVLEEVRRLRGGILVIEMISSYGMPVGKQVFETCVWIGRFLEASPVETFRVPRKEVVLELTGSSRGGDANVRRVLLDAYYDHDASDPLQNEPARGTKKHPGPLYHLRKDLWQAFGLAFVVARRLLDSGQVTKEG